MSPKSRLSFWEHVEALRSTLLKIGCALTLGMALCFLFHESLLHLLLTPLGPHRWVILSPLEGFTTVLKVSLWGGILISSPFWFTFLIQFFVPGLRAKERRLILPFLGLSLLFTAGGLSLGYQITLPLVTSFFERFNAGLGENMWSLAKTVDFTLGLLLAHGIVFELYVGLLFLIHFGLLTRPLLQKGRRYIYVIMLILAAILTPPDLISQLLLAVPMFCLYESALLYAHFRYKPQEIN